MNKWEQHLINNKEEIEKEFQEIEKIQNELGGKFEEE